MIPDAAAPLVPLVARVLALGRGPPALVRWVNLRLSWGLGPRELASRLAREFERLPFSPDDTVSDPTLNPQRANR